MKKSFYLSILLLWSCTYVLAQNYVPNPNQDIINFPDLGSLTNENVVSELSNYSEALRRFRNKNQTLNASSNTTSITITTVVNGQTRSEPKTVLEGPMHYVAKFDTEEFVAYMHFRAINFEGSEIRFIKKSDLTQPIAEIDRAIQTKLNEINSITNHKNRYEALLENGFKQFESYNYGEFKDNYALNFETWSDWFQFGTKKGNEFEKIAVIGITSEAARSTTLECQIKSHLLYATKQGEVLNFEYYYAEGIVKNFGSAVKERYNEEKAPADKLYSSDVIMKREGTNWKPLNDADYNRIAIDNTKANEILKSNINKADKVKELKDLSEKTDHLRRLNGSSPISTINRHIRYKLGPYEAGESSTSTTSMLIQGGTLEIPAFIAKKVGYKIPCTIQNFEDANKAKNKGIADGSEKYNLKHFIIFDSETTYQKLLEAVQKK